MKKTTIEKILDFAKTPEETKEIGELLLKLNSEIFDSINNAFNNSSYGKSTQTN